MTRPEIVLQAGHSGLDHQQEPQHVARA
jgi:hypothetical protein